MIAGSRERFYTAGGTLNPASPSYVERGADIELFEAAHAGEFCYVLTARQMGKSSLMARVSRRLQDAGTLTAPVDLSLILSTAGGVAPKAWYKAVTRTIARALRLDHDSDGWWQQGDTSPVQRLTEFFEDVVLPGTGREVVVFIDEIDTTLRLSGADDFFAAIRACYNSRATSPEYGRLTFVLLGVASPDQLIQDKSRTPFNIGRQIHLVDFRPEEAAALRPGLPGDAARQQRLLDRVLYWTAGHPFLTQKVCSILATANPVPDEPDVDRVVNDVFFAPGAERNETNLSAIAARMAEDPQRLHMLRLYLRVRSSEDITDSPRDPVFSALKLTGLVAILPAGELKVRNRIYEQVFTPEWANARLRSDPAEFYVTGGTVRPAALSYVERRADAQLMENILDGRHCCLLSPRQMGRSSLMACAVRKLNETGIVTVFADLSAFGNSATTDEWFDSLAFKIQKGVFPLLPDNEDVMDWWESRAFVPNAVRLLELFRKLVGPGPDRRMVLFVDEIDFLEILSFRAEIYSALAALCSLDGLILVVSGAGPGLPEPLGSLLRQIPITDFTFSEAQVLSSALGADSETNARRLDRILYWTGGHPYLTQVLCRYVAESGSADIDAIVKEHFFSAEGQRYEPNLQFVADRFLRSPEALAAYGRVRSGRRVRYEPRRHAALLLSGVVTPSQDGSLQVRNRIYETVFNPEWVRRNKVPWVRTHRRSLAAGMFLALPALAWLLWTRSDAYQVRSILQWARGASIFAPSDNFPAASLTVLQWTVVSALADGPDPAAYAKSVGLGQAPDIYAQTLAEAAVAYRILGDAPKSDSLLKEALDRIRTGDRKFRSIYYSELSIAQMLAAGGYPDVAAPLAKEVFYQWDKDINLAETNLENGPPCGQERYVGGLLGKVGLSNDVRSAAANLLSHVRPRKARPDEDIFVVCAIDYYVGLGDFGQAESTIPRLSDESRDYERIVEIARLAAAGEPHATVETALRAKYYEHETMPAAAAAVIAMPSPDEALPLADTLPEPWKSDALRGVLSAMATHPNHSGEAAAKARAIQSLSERVLALISIAAALERQGRRKDSALLEQEALNLIATLPDAPRSRTMAALASSYAKLGHLRKARLTAEQCALTPDRAAASTAILAEYLKAKYPERRKVIDFVISLPGLTQLLPYPEAFPESDK